jgi:hypothetical protein
MHENMAVMSFIEPIVWQTEYLRQADVRVIELTMVIYRGALDMNYLSHPIRDLVGEFSNGQ